MMIRNFKSLATNTLKKDALTIIEAGLQAALPQHSLEKIIHSDHLRISSKDISLKKYDNIFVIAIGKAAYFMAKSVSTFTHMDGGLVIVPKNTKIKPIKKFEIIHAGHPIPNRNSVFAAKKILGFLRNTNHNDFVLFLISGGASALATLPDGITLSEKQLVTDLLLRSGASIHEINCIRKHLSKIKGGRLLEHLRSHAISLIISDVVGNDLTSIASGITYYDKTTFVDASKILKKYHLERSIPKNVARHLEQGIERKISETPKKAKIRNYIISTNKDCLDAMRMRATELGFSSKIISDISGDVKKIGEKLVKTLYDKKSGCLIFGGEPTVKVKKGGKGGRNQELVLHMALNLRKQYKNVILSSVGTDGIDGKTNYAGAIWQSGQKIDKILPYVEKNNSFNFFKKYGGLVFTGPTGTNLMDIGIILRK